jgi:PAS domain S-box-containing protein
MAETPPNGETALPEPDAPAAPDPPLRARWFRFYFADERWEWSPEAAQIHGYEPGTEITPTTALGMSHKHPDDYARMAAHLDQVRRTHEAISTRHRIIDAKGRTRDVVVVGQEMFDDSGAVIGTTGFYIDATPDQQLPGEATQARDQVLTDALSVIVESRSTIDQVKGMLMLI